MRRFLKDLASYAWPSCRPRPSKGWNDFFFTAGRSDASGSDPDCRGACSRSGACSCSGFDLHDYFGSTGWADPTRSGCSSGPCRGRSGSLCPTPGCDRSGSCCLGILFLFAVGLFSRVTAVLELGDRGVDGSSTADRVIRIRPGSLGVAAVPGGDGSERPGGVARPVSEAMAASTRTRRDQPGRSPRRTVRDCRSARMSREYRRQRFRRTWRCD